MEIVPLKEHVEKLLAEHRAHVDARFDHLESRLDDLPSWPKIYGVITGVVAAVGGAVGWVINVFT